MFKIIRMAVFLLVWLPLAAFAADRPVNEADFSAYKELSQAKLDAAKESLQKDREKTEVRLDAQDKRIGDLNLTFTLWGILITLLMVGLGAASWFSARDRAREEAREAAKKWFEEASKGLEGEIEELRQRVKESCEHIQKLEEDAARHFQSAKDEVHEKATAAMEAMQREIGSRSGGEAFGIPYVSAGKDGEALEQMAQAIREKPEAQYGFDDWNTRAFSAWVKNDYEEAAYHWKKAAQARDAASVQIAQSLGNAGVALNRLNRSEDAIAAYDEVEQRFDGATEAALREQVAQALYNKGVALNRLNRSEDAIVAYDEVEQRFGGEVVSRKPVAMARVNKGFGLLCQAKQCWEDSATRLADLQAAAALFERAICDVEDKPMVWGNQAYAAFLLGQHEVARPLLLQALQQGGEGLYKAELGDLDIHPVPPDKEFRAMLEELWAEVKPKA